MLLNREDLPWQKGTDWQFQRWKIGSSVRLHPAPRASNPRPAEMTFKDERGVFSGLFFGGFLRVFLARGEIYHRKVHFSSPLNYNDSYLVTVNWVMQNHVYRSEQKGKVEDWKNLKHDYVVLI